MVLSQNGGLSGADSEKIIAASVASEATALSHHEGHKSPQAIGQATR